MKMQLARPCNLQAQTAGPISGSESINGSNPPHLVQTGFFGHNTGTLLSSVWARCCDANSGPRRINLRNLICLFNTNHGTRSDDDNSL